MNYFDELPYACNRGLSLNQKLIRIKNYITDYKGILGEVNDRKDL